MPSLVSIESKTGAHSNGKLSTATVAYAGTRPHTLIGLDGGVDERKGARPKLQLGACMSLLVFGIRAA